MRILKGFKRFLRFVLYFLISGCLLLIYALIEPYLIRINEVEISSADVPASFNHTKIIFVSDIHHGLFFSIKRVKSMVDKINALHPDVIILGGDYVHRRPEYIVPVFGELAKLKAKLGVYAVLGNHDYWEDDEKTEECMDSAKINNIENHSFWVKKGNDSLKIGGVGDLWESKQLIENTISDVNQRNFCILVSHNPDYCEQLKTRHIDLVLCGHTHGGQVSLFGFWSPVVPSRFGQKYCYGLKKVEDFQIYITSGIGIITPPVRFCMRPEIVVFTIKSK
jgi:uncharacterized protein